MENLNYESFKQDINERRKVVCNNFQQKKNGFSAEIDLKSEKIIFLVYHMKKVGLQLLMVKKQRY